MTHPMMIKWLGLALVLLHAGGHVQATGDECWTPWFDQDDPSGTGDYETLYELHKEYPGKICERPSRIEVITTSGASVESTGNVIQVSDAHTGFICQNTDQPCADYKVRFMCPLEFCKPTECWTPWINRDSPGGFGDYETLPSLLKEYPDKICEYPTGIEARTVSGASVESTGNAIHAFNTENGFICRNTDQHNNWPCADYEVRFSCPLEFCRPAECWTPWMNRDSPGGFGDYETLSDLQKENPGKVCEHPIGIEARAVSGASVASTGNVIQVSDTRTGFICRNVDQPYNWLCADYEVRFSCPLEFCEHEVCKTSWFNQDKPSGTGDYEILDKIFAENPGEMCRLPLGIEAQTVDGKPSTSTGDTIAVVDTETGLICRNSDQMNGRCSDYKVRFICPLDFCGTKE
nr:uncharacterized protein LOC125972244 isoform X4 [Syngnathus scovelli]